jgi:hypothetical protein
LAVKKKRKVGIRPGPKPKRAEEKRRNRVMLNLTDAELARLERAAKGKPISSLAREVVIRYLARCK